MAGIGVIYIFFTLQQLFRVFGISVAIKWSGRRFSGNKRPPEFTLVKECL
jgi:hypothetical protein